jgi:hypothetical protein
MDVLGQKPVTVSLGQPAWDQHGPPLGKASSHLPEPQYRHFISCFRKMEYCSIQSCTVSEGALNFGGKKMEHPPILLTWLQLILICYID